MTRGMSDAPWVGPIIAPSVSLKTLRLAGVTANVENRPRRKG
jgi:hypothetical protein